MSSKNVPKKRTIIKISVQNSEENTTKFRITEAELNVVSPFRVEYSMFLRTRLLYVVVY